MGSGGGHLRDIMRLTLICSGAGRHRCLSDDDQCPGNNDGRVGLGLELRRLAGKPGRELLFFA